MSATFDDLFDEEVIEKEKPEDVLTVVTRKCHACPLNLVNPENRGFYYTGSLLAQVAFLSDAPTKTSMARKKPMGEDYGKEFLKWLPRMGLSREGVLITNVVQCAPKARKDADADLLDRKNEVDVCFPLKALRLLQAMPNLEVVVTLGWEAIATVLGIAKAGQKTHEGHWFGTERLPGVAVYSMPHISSFHEGMSWDDKGRLVQLIEFFVLEYATDRKILQILREGKPKQE